MSSLDDGAVDGHVHARDNAAKNPHETTFRVVKIARMSSVDDRGRHTRNKATNNPAWNVCEVRRSEEHGPTAAPQVVLAVRSVASRGRIMRLMGKGKESGFFLTFADVHSCDV